MTFSVNAVEALWIGLNLVALVLTMVLLVDARADREAVRLLNGKARELAASGTVRREWFRLVTQTLLLGVAVPGLFSDREAVLSPVVVLLMAVPVVLLAASFLDYIDRKRMVVLVTADVLLVRNTALDRIEEAIAENTVISQAARNDAQEAASVANHMNAKLFRQQEAGLAQGRERDAEAVILSETIDTTAAQVAELHEGTAPEKPS